MQKKLPLLDNSHPSLAKQSGLPMHSQSTNHGNFKLNSLNLAPILLLNPVLSLMQRNRIYIRNIFERSFSKITTKTFTTESAQMRTIFGRLGKSQVRFPSCEIFGFAPCSQNVQSDPLGSLLAFLDIKLKDAL